jgi:sugar lactone lactonase YvrE
VLSAPSGDLYIADTDNACVWKVAPDQQISRFAGTGYSGYGGDDGIPAAQSALNTPWGLAMDRFGNIYIADENQHRVRKVVNGVISTVAGNGTRGDSGDGGPATSASLDWPRGIAVDADGSLYIADYSNSRIRKVTPDGMIRTVAGTGQAGWTPEGGKAAEIAIGVPEGLALDADGNLYFSDSRYIRKLSPDGTLTTVAGSPTSDSYTGDWGPALGAGGTTALTAPVPYLCQSSKRPAKRRPSKTRRSKSVMQSPASQARCSAAGPLTADVLTICFALAWRVSERGRALPNRPVPDC